jgi:benzoyl-CoA reductase/2-hydroxyglutaryl-CoA dehydratase subunit BcrC/BadD/HgdB
MGQPTLRQQITELPLKARNFSTLALLAARIGPLEFARLYRKYPWMPMAARIHGLMDHAMNYRGCMGEAIHVLLQYMSDILETHVRNPENLVWHEELLTGEIPRAMGLTPFMTESLGLIFPLLDRNAGVTYVDRTENAGFPADMCSFIKHSLGQVLADELPRPRLILTTNSPCDSAMAGYVPIEKRLGVPVFRLDHPFETNERSLEYYARGLWKMIDFLEAETGRKMDFDCLKEICEERNRASEYLLEFRELLRTRPAPIGGLMLTISILGHQVFPGMEATTKFCKYLRDEAGRRVAAKTGAVEDERIRVILWNPPFLIDGGFFQWMEETYGAVVVMDMLAYRSYSLIDTSSPESMIRGLAYDMMKGPMARHTRGPAKNYYDDLIRLYGEYEADMVLVASHQGCKNALALAGILRDLFRKRDIPLLDIHYDLVDPRVTSPEEIRNQVAHFMETVMSDAL